MNATKERKMDAVTFDTLDAEWQRVKDTLQGTDLGLRMRRATSWIECAAKADDDDARFIFYWIAFNAAYGRRDRKPGEVTEREVFAEYFGNVLGLDTDDAVHDAIWERFAGPVRIFLDNRYVFRPFWEHHNDNGHDDWEKQFERRRRKVYRALGRRETGTILSELFDCLYVLRNQIMHGGATWKGSVNRPQVRDGARIMAFLVPRFASLMMSNPRIDWGPPRFPVVD